MMEVTISNEELVKSTDLLGLYRSKGIPWGEQDVEMRRNEDGSFTYRWIDNAVD